MNYKLFLYFIIIYLCYAACRKKGDAPRVQCADCDDATDEILKFVLLGPHGKAYEAR